VFGPDAPYGRPLGGLFQTMRVAAYAGLAADERALVAGGTISALPDGRPLPAATAPRIAQVRPASGRLMRVSSHLTLAAFGLVMAASAIAATEPITQD